MGHRLNPSTMGSERESGLSGIGLSNSGKIAKLGSTKDGQMFYDEAQSPASPLYEHKDIGTAKEDLIPHALGEDGKPLVKKSARGGELGEGRGCVARTFSALNAGSLRGSVFSLSASAIGSGVLSLPYVCNLCGYIAGPVLMLIAAFAANLSLRMLVKLAVLGDMKSYSKICVKAGGQKLANLLSALVIIFMFGSCIGYQVIITQLL